MKAGFPALAATALAGFAVGALTLGDRTPRSGAVVQGQNLDAPAVGIDRRGDRIAAAIVAINSGDDLHALADLGAALEGLDGSQIAALFDRLERQRTIQSDERFTWLFGWWMKRDPKSAGAWLRPRLDRFTLLGATGVDFSMTSHGKLLGVWLKADPAAALDYALAHARSGLALSILHNLDPKTVGKSDGEWFAILRALPENGQQRETIATMLAGWAGRDTSAALSAAQSLPAGFVREQALGAVLKKWSQTNADAAIREYRKLGITGPYLLSDMLANAMKKDRSQALQLVGELDAPDFARCAPRIVDAWAQTDAVAALSWALEHGVPLATQGQLRTSSSPSWLSFENRVEFESVSPFAIAMAVNAGATLAWIHTLPPGPDREGLLLLAMKEVSPSNSLSLFNELSPANSAKAAMSLGTRFASSPVEGRAWAESLPGGPIRAAAWRGLGSGGAEPADLPPGADRDALLSGRASGRFGNNEVIASFDIAMQISDPVLRRDTFDLCMQQCLGGDRNGWAEQARAWMEKAEIPEEWKQRWR